MSSPQSAFVSGRSQAATFLQCVPGSTVGFALTQKSPGLAMGLPNDLEHGAPSLDKLEMQWRAVTTTFGLTNTPEHRSAGLLGPPVAIATACTVFVSNMPPSTAWA